MNNFPALSEDPVQKVQEAVVAALAEQWDDVGRHLGDIKLPPDRKPGANAALGPKEVIREPPELTTTLTPSQFQELVVKVYHRDNFICRYCGSKTVFSPVLYILSALCSSQLKAPEIFLYHSSWTKGGIHDFYYLYSTAPDHIIPKALLGQDTEQNLLTACCWCNNYKNYYTLERLGWNKLDPVPSSWRGLSEYFLELDKLCRKHNIALTLTTYKPLLNLFRKYNPQS
ncbi:MAG: HNH endonuclease [Chloroflexota bacterium]|nr:HNH endonuclease [Chloroflexota bacterium]